MVPVSINATHNPGRQSLYRYVTLVAVLGPFVYNTCAIYPFYPFIRVCGNAALVEDVFDDP